MADPATGLGRPDAQCDRECVSYKHCPADPCGLTGKFDQGKKRYQRQNPRCVDHRGGEIGTMAVLPEGSFTRNIHPGTDRSINKGFISLFSRLHNEGHGSGTQNHGKQTGSKGSTTMEKNTDQDRQASDSQADDRDMVNGQMDMCGGEESLHKLILREASRRDRIRQERSSTALALLLKNSVMSNGQGTAGNVIASLASFFIPGLGQLLQGRLLPAILFFVFTGILWVFLLGWIIHLWACLDAALWKPKS